MTTSADAASSDHGPCELRVPLQRAAGADMRRIARQHGHVVAARKQPLHERLAEESRSAGDHDLHAAIL